MPQVKGNRILANQPVQPRSPSVEKANEKDKYYDWLNPLNKTVLIATFKHKLPKVRLDNGREYKINYDKRPGFAWVSPIEGTVPCGWFELKAMNRHWLDRG
jgi:hypothetical protein